jgi:hypothetical protein
MSKGKSIATLSKGRQSWCVIFWHPVSRGADGKPKRVRRGLGTSDREQAQKLVNELNEILADETTWSPANRERATAKYDAKVVAAFFDSMQSELRDGWATRDEMLPLPGGEDADDGYARVQFIGTTGAGKTTVLRQLIGTDPEKERFPSISAAKTTICDIEVILDDNPFRGAVTFIPRDQVRQYVCECIMAAITSHMEGSTEQDVIRRFLEHSEQKFRLSYILGNPLSLRTADEPELMDEDDEDRHESEDLLISDEDQGALLAVLENYLSQITELARTSHEKLTQTALELDIEIDKAPKQDLDTIHELVEDQLPDNEYFQSFVDAILDDVEQRFTYLDNGELVRGRDGWPIKWSFSTLDRDLFIRTINRFSSNSAANFGRLLTPLVDGIRVAGPFTPAWRKNEQPRLVLMDGQGIGHTADSTSSLSTSVTKRFKLADAIMLVDNAAQPMQAAPCAVLHALVASGHESKLVLAFTHFDEVKGDNLVNITARKDHIVSSFDNAAKDIGKTFGREAELTLHRLNPERLIFLSNIQRRVGNRARFTCSELNRMITAIMSTITPVGPIDYKPVYDVANFVFAVQNATQKFHERWRGILGKGPKSGVPREHWARVKALTRRLGIFKRDEYASLRPVADLINLLQVQISQFLTSPLAWNPVAPPEDSEDRQVAIDMIKKDVHTRLHDLAKARVLEERVKDWVEAYEHRGAGSTFVRASEVVKIYEEAAPVPNEMPGPDANQFLFEIRDLVSDCIRAAGGQVRGWSDK